MNKELKRTYEGILQNESEAKKFMELKTPEEMYDYFKEKIPNLSEEEFEDFIVTMLDDYANMQEKEPALVSDALNQVAGGVGLRKLSRQLAAGALAISSFLPASASAAKIKTNQYNNQYEQPILSDYDYQEYDFQQEKGTFNKIKKWIKNHKLAVGVSLASILVSCLAIKKFAIDKKNANKTPDKSTEIKSKTAKATETTKTTDNKTNKTSPEETPQETQEETLEIAPSTPPPSDKPEETSTKTTPKKTTPKRTTAPSFKATPKKNVDPKLEQEAKNIAEKLKEMLEFVQHSHHLHCSKIDYDPYYLVDGIECLREGFKYREEADQLYARFNEIKNKLGAEQRYDINAKYKRFIKLYNENLDKVDEDSKEYARGTGKAKDVFPYRMEKAYEILDKLLPKTEEENRTRTYTAEEARLIATSGTIIEYGHRVYHIPRTEKQESIHKRNLELCYNPTFMKGLEAFV